MWHVSKLDMLHTQEITRRGEILNFLLDHINELRLEKIINDECMVLILNWLYGDVGISGKELITFLFDYVDKKPISHDQRCDVAYCFYILGEFVDTFDETDSMRNLVLRRYGNRKV